VSLEDDILAEAKARRERLEHPRGGHTSTDLDILSEPAARALAMARLEAEAEDAQREAERVEAETRWWGSMIEAAEAENRRRDASERAIARKITRFRKAEMQQETEPRLCKPPPKLRDIARAVAAYYGVTVLELAANSRTARVMRPRQVFCYLARMITFKSFPDIGRYLGGRDHSTVIHSFNRIAIIAATDPELADEIAHIRAQLEGTQV